MLSLCLRIRSLASVDTTWLRFGLRQSSTAPGFRLRHFGYAQLRFGLRQSTTALGFRLRHFGNSEGGAQGFVDAYALVGPQAHSHTTPVAPLSSRRCTSIDSKFCSRGFERNKERKNDTCVSLRLERKCAISRVIIDYLLLAHLPLKQRVSNSNSNCSTSPSNVAPVLLLKKFEFKQEHLCSSAAPVFITEF